MAKRFGVSEESIKALLEGLKNPQIFSERELVALEFAETMSENRKMTDELWSKLKEHFDDGEVIEIACVVGVFNYFNRFNNVLDVDITK
ncbi:carboxymuconolactone decarboxylase family protein [Alkaliphilus serpentinus]|uniref:Carboxymuconolactone decarboxylase family protein n=1 Tax=Alkaliphilus serpentinus TaxID=1482731 RepID=A0A833HP89_9FIRM|nr:carboxymuconolactone decarboxylase family protein [Alkaliphilus serpentinus]KAB3530450.1 carboxymuconolactone decarboxylase family protein [Alkaliphilus serpentinus]